MTPRSTRADGFVPLRERVATRSIALDPTAPTRCTCSQRSRTVSRSAASSPTSVRSGSYACGLRMRPSDRLGDPTDLLRDKVRWTG
jgi:hypothetical protein